VEDVFEQVVAENRELRKQLKTLRERMSAFESSRWWRLHPRHLLKPHGPSAGCDERTSAKTKVQRHAQIWTLKGDYERRSIGRKPDEVVVREGIRLRVHPDSRASFEEFCYSSPQQVEELALFIAATSDRSRLLDIGAMHGIFSLVFTAGDPSRQALAVDPSPAAFAKLLYNIHRNRAETVTAVECALSSEAGVLEMHYEWERAVAGRTADGPGPLRVEAETGDTLCERYSFDPDVVKIDVDGHEVRVIQGLRETLRRNKPLLFLEVHPQLIAAEPGNATVTELVEELRALGFRPEYRGSVVELETIVQLDEIDRFLLRP
jgi:FkbM family methyltransferase